jgi:hypothetical protein
MAAGTLAYGLTSGICVTAAVVFIVLGWRRPRRDRVTISFGVACLAGAAMTMATLWLHSSQNVGTYRMVLKSAFALSNVALLIALLWLVAEWTQLGTRRLGAFVSAATLLVLVVHLALPAGLLANGVTELRSVSLFGEEFVVHQASRSPWRPLLDVYLLAMTGLAAWAIARAVRRSPNAAVRLKWHWWNNARSCNFSSSTSVRSGSKNNPVRSWIRSRRRRGTPSGTESERASVAVGIVGGEDGPRRIPAVQRPAG